MGESEWDLPMICIVKVALAHLSMLLCVQVSKVWKPHDGEGAFGAQKLSRKVLTEALVVEGPGART